jgi:uncharacterized protein YaaQ
MKNKLIIAIVNKEDSKKLSEALVKSKFSVTKLATQGGFLMNDNITLLVGTTEDKVPEVIKIMERYSQRRTEIVPITAGYGFESTPAFPLEVTVGGATIFVVDVEQFIKV